MGDPAALSDGEGALARDLESRGMTVAVAPAAGPGSLADGKSMIIASSNADPAALATTFKDAAVPLLVFGRSFDVSLGMVAAGAGNTGGVDGSTALLALTGAGTPLVADLATGTAFTAHPSRSSTLAWATPGGTPIPVAAIGGAVNQAVVFGFERGVAMATGSAAGRRVALGWSIESYGALSVPAYKLTLAAFKWAAATP